MKKILFALLVISVNPVPVNAQFKLPPIDKSPMDMSYCPDKYPVLKIQDKITEPLVARVIYSRPQKNSRLIFGELVEYGKVWRLGANEATEIDFYQNVRIDDKKLRKGRYTMYCIPYNDKWTLIFNKEVDTWGAFKYDEKKDILRVDLLVTKQTDITDAFVMAFQKTANGADLVIAWDDVKVALPITY